jgi:uncharacterized coiled-coil protein SlyX
MQDSTKWLKKRVNFCLMELKKRSFQTIEKRLYQEGAAVDRYQATDADKALIRKHVSKGYDVDSLGIYQVVASSTNPDMEGHIMSKAVLDKLAADYRKGKTIVLGSHDRGSGVGKSFDAHVEPFGDGHQLLVKFYVAPDMVGPNGSPAKSLIDTGVYSESSIYALFTEKPNVEKVEKDGQTHLLFKDGKGMETVHLAIVDIGMNRDAVMKSITAQSARFDTNSFEAESDNQNTEQMNDLKYNAPALGKSGAVAIEKGAVQSLIEELNSAGVSQKETIAKQATEIETLKKELSEFRSQKETELNKLKEEYQNLSKQVSPDTPAEKLEKRAGLYSLENMDLLAEDVADLKKQVAALKGNPTPTAPPAPSPQAGSAKNFDIENV